MSALVRFGVSLEKELLARFDRHIRGKKYENRSEAIRSLIRGEFVKEEWTKGREIVGAIVLVYNHHKRELVNKLTNIQHGWQKLIISSQHIHLEHDNCLETIIIKGKPEEVEELASRLKAVKGVKHGTIAITAATKELE